MEDVQLIRDFLERARVKKSDAALVAEMIYTIEALAEIDEKRLQSIKWITKEGRERDLLTGQNITDILSRREELAARARGVPARIKALREGMNRAYQEFLLVEFMKSFMTTEQAAFSANMIRGSLSTLVDIYRQGRLDTVVEPDMFNANLVTNIEKAIEHAIQTPDPVQTLKQLTRDRDVLSELVALTLYANRLTDRYGDFGARTFVINMGPLATVHSSRQTLATLESAASKALPDRAVKKDIAAILERVQHLYSGRLLPTERNVIAAFTSAICTVLTVSVPKYTAEAIATTHPFLVRPLFRSYPAALTYAVGGKIASSLETIWGSTGEALMLAMNPVLRPVRNGGIDVIHGRAAYDIKSGPAIMNRDQIAVLHLKQNMIKAGKVPSLDSIQVALVYGRQEAIFGTMTNDVADGNILLARQSWQTLSGDPLAPERVYALAGLLADVIGVPNAIESIGANEKQSARLDEDFIAKSDEEFRAFFDNAFDPPPAKIPEASKDRLNAIETINRHVRELLKV